MVAAGRLEMRVVLPLGPDGRPLPAHLAQDYFHAKEGVFTDACGHQVAFSGSVNETPHGWLRNYEQFSVYFSWDATYPYLAQVVERFRRLWEGEEEGWRALPVPEAVRRRLVAQAPEEPPVRDPEEEAVSGGCRGPGPEPTARLPADQRERIVFAFLRDAPFMDGGHLLGVRTAGVRPWPHQARVVEEIVRRFPERFLLADEVGLGKTIEAGLVLRSLLLSGAVRRCLILVPKSLVRQWQEELYEKFCLNVPAFDGSSFRDYFGPVADPGGNPWDAFPVLLASSQLAKMEHRVRELLGAEPWDLVLVDEAHHAGRRDFREGVYRPNRFLALLEGEDGRPGLAARTEGLLLLTATPMQVHPVQLYDLLRQLDLPPAWAASEGRFLGFLQELRNLRDGSGDWRTVLGLARAGLRPDGGLPDLSGQLGAVGWARVRGLFLGERPLGEVSLLSEHEKAALLELCRQASPIGRKMFRSTRETLRRYHERGLLRERIPERAPEPVWINMSPAEWALYERVETYVREHYYRFEGERKGLGFILTVYRRRLTSSVAALRRSLERRRDFLLGRTDLLFGLTDEDTEDADLVEDLVDQLSASAAAYRVAGPLPASVRQRVERELKEIESLLGDVARLTEDTKFVRLADDLRTLLARRETVAVFTHYTDTMDDLRERLVGVYDRALACYSGRGGERWDGSRWVAVSKEEVKNAFRRGEIRVLLCTEAASEGLNLQTCGILLNYDMPWNPMRVEQRIGRFDRIGQTYPDVWIRHYFTLGPRGEETVEAKVYSALSDRIDWFRAVVGELGPILARLEKVITRAVLEPVETREAVLADALADVRREIEAQTALVSIDEWAEGPLGESYAVPPLDLADLERVLRGSSLGQRFSPHPTMPGALRLDWGGRLWDVTFDPAVADAHPGRVRLLTFGEPLLKELLDAAREPAALAVGTPAISVPVPGIIRVAAGTRRGWFVPEGPETVRPIATLAELERCLEGRLTGRLAPVQAVHVAAACRMVEDAARQERSRSEELERTRRDSRLEVLKERARLVLAEAAAAVALARDLDASSALVELAGSGYPWAPLARLVGYPGSDQLVETLGRYLAEESPPSAEELKTRAAAILEAVAEAVKEAAAPEVSGPASPTPTAAVLRLE
ncbi:MAG: DEAD/DEAH box helicase family protein [Firmicutes bacterium]|nr:DEAD/DEAH box helicase family protein [Bacillota bacterium]